MLKRVVYPAYAKLNLTLSVAAPEAPGTPRAGWHRIASWFHAIELHDDVTVSRLKDEPARVRIEWAPDAPRPTPIDWPVEKDLAARAHALLEKTLARRLSCEIVLSKRIPVGGGLGGGSSDAAATLVALNRLFSLGQSVEQLQKIGGELGSDVAFFIDEREMPRPAIVLAFGDVIERRSRLSGPVELFVPEFGCETRAVYQAFDRLIDAGHPLRGQSVRDIAARAEESGRFDGAGWFNDLRKAADVVSGGKLSELERAIGTEAPVLMSGSGSTLFVLGESRVGALPAGTVRVSTRLV